MDDLGNPLIKKGMTAQLATRRTRIAAGERPLESGPGLADDEAETRFASTGGRLLDAARIARFRQHGIAQGLHQADDGARDWSAHGARFARRGYGKSSRCGN